MPEGMQQQDEPAVVRFGERLQVEGHGPDNTGRPGPLPWAFVRQDGGAVDQAGVR